MKIWLKLIIVGLIIFFGGIFVLSGVIVGTGTGLQYMMIPMVGLILAVVGGLIGLSRGYRRAMRE